MNTASERTILGKWLGHLRLAQGLFALAALGLLAFGVLGVGRGGGWADGNGDFKYLYIGGRLWMDQASPYVLADMQSISSFFGFEASNPLAYSPTISAFCVMLAALPFGVARVVFAALNVTSLAILVWMAWQTWRASSETNSRVAEWYIGAIIVGNPFTTHVFWMGQTSLLAGAAAALAFYWSGKSRWALAGVALGFASMKPQLLILVAVWLLLERRWWVFAVGTAAGVVFALPALLADGFALPWAWLNAVKQYQDTSCNAIAFSHTFGLRSFLTDFGIWVPDLLPLALVAVGFMYAQRTRFVRLEVLGYLLALSTSLVFSHDYDLAACGLLVPTLMRGVAGNLRLEVLASAAMLWLFFPQRFVLTVAPQLPHFREPVFLVLLFGAIILRSRAAQAVPFATEAPQPP